MSDTPDRFTTLASVGEGLYRSRGSKFIGRAQRLDDEAALPAVLDALRGAHPKARHWCYAYRIGLSGDRWRANDDGEPGNSAGRPILGQIDAAGVTNVVVVVIRYFGGTKLGVPGLIEAYKSAAAEALAAAERLEAVIERGVEITTDYTRYNTLLQAANEAPWRVVTLVAETQVQVHVACPASDFEAAFRRLWLVLAEAYPGEERLEESPPGYRITLREP